MIQLFIPLTGLVCLLAYYFLSSDMRLSKRLQELEKMRNNKSEETQTQKYYGWELHDLV